jgi:hypothetical protein
MSFKDEFPEVQKLKDDNQRIEAERRVMDKAQGDVAFSLHNQISSNEIKTILNALQTEIKVNGRLLPVMSLYIAEKGSQAEKDIIEGAGDHYPRSIKDIESVMKMITLFNSISDDMNQDVETRSRAVFQRNPNQLITQAEADKYTRHIENRYKEAKVEEMAWKLRLALDLSDKNLIKSKTMDSKKLEVWFEDLFEICENKDYIESRRAISENAGKGTSRNIRIILGHMTKDKVLSSGEARTLGTYYMRYHNDAAPPGLLKSAFRHVEKINLVVPAIPGISHLPAVGFIAVLGSGSGGIATDVGVENAPAKISYVEVSRHANIMSELPNLKSAFSMSDNSHPAKLQVDPKYPAPFVK